MGLTTERKSEHRGPNTRSLRTAAFLANVQMHGSFIQVETILRYAPFACTQQRTR